MENTSNRIATAVINPNTSQGRAQRKKRKKNKKKRKVGVRQQYYIVLIVGVVITELV